MLPQDRGRQWDRITHHNVLGSRHCCPHNHYLHHTGTSEGCRCWWSGIWCALADMSSQLCFITSMHYGSLKINLFIQLTNNLATCFGNNVQMHLPSSAHPRSHCRSNCLFRCRRIPVRCSGRYCR